MVGTWGWTGKVILGVSGLVCPLSLSVGKWLLYPIDASGGLLITEPHPWLSQSIQATVIKGHRTG